MHVKIWYLKLVKEQNETSQQNVYDYEKSRALSSIISYQFDVPCIHYNLFHLTDSIYSDLKVVLGVVHSAKVELRLVHISVFLYKKVPSNQASALMEFCCRSNKCKERKRMNSKTKIKGVRYLRIVNPNLQDSQWQNMHMLK